MLLCPNGTGPTNNTNNTSHTNHTNHTCVSTTTEWHWRSLVGLFTIWTMASVAAPLILSNIYIYINQWLNRNQLSLLILLFGRSRLTGWPKRDECFRQQKQQRQQPHRQTETTRQKPNLALSSTYRVHAYQQASYI